MVCITQVHGDYDIVSGSKRAQCTETTFRALNVTKKKAANCYTLVVPVVPVQVAAVVVVVVVDDDDDDDRIQEISNRTHGPRTPKPGYFSLLSRNLLGKVRWDSVPFNFWWMGGCSTYVPKIPLFSHEIHEVIEHAHRVQNSRIAWKGWILGGSVDSCYIHGTTMNNCNLRGTIVSSPPP